MCPEKTNKSTNLLGRTIFSQRIKDTEHNNNMQFKNNTNDSEWYSLVTDELTDVTDTTQFYLT